MVTETMDEMRKHAPVCWGSILILGLGKSGRAVCDYLLQTTPARAKTITVALEETRESDQAVIAELAEQNVEFIIGKDAREQAIENHFDACIASPGISQFSDFYQWGAQVSTEIMSEVEFAWRESARDSVWVAITGTNGKTTTTALTAYLLQSCGLPAAAVGNIGDTCIAAVAQGSIGYYVAEVSSYQLASTHCFAPDVAVLLNITPDHLTWHRSMEAYIEAKQKIYAHVTGTVVLDATNDIVRAMVKELKALAAEERGFSYIPLGTAEGIYDSMISRCGSENAAYVHDGKLCVVFNGQTHELISASELQIKGEHNIANALAAAAAVIALVPNDDAAIDMGLKTFEPLEHRIEPCGSVAGVACYNDSKATNVDSTLKALMAFGEQHPLVLLGGDDKGTDLSELVATAEEHSKGVVCFGEGGPRFFEAFSQSPLPHKAANHLEDAFDTALSMAEPGDIIILSPACASFDEFSCYQERGKVFKSLVAKRAQERGA